MHTKEQYCKYILSVWGYTSAIFPVFASYIKQIWVNWLISILPKKESKLISSLKFAEYPGLNKLHAQW